MWEDKTIMPLPAAGGGGGTNFRRFIHSLLSSSLGFLLVKLPSGAIGEMIQAPSLPLISVFS